MVYAIATHHSPTPARPPTPARVPDPISPSPRPTPAGGQCPDASARPDASNCKGRFARVVEITSLAEFRGSELRDRDRELGFREPRNRPVRKVADHHIPRMKRVFAHVEAHLDTRLRVAELAGVACLSPAQFTRVFKTFTGQSPHQFILDCRVRVACRLIRRGGSSLACVAMDVGFASQSHMTDVFRSRIGMSPGMVADAMPTELPPNLPPNLAHGVPQPAPAPMYG